MTPGYSIRLRLIDLVHNGEIMLNPSSRSRQHFWRNKNLSPLTDDDFMIERAELINSYVTSSGLSYEDVDKLLVSVEKQYVAVAIKKIRDLADSEVGQRGVTLISAENFTRVRVLLTA